MAQLQRVNCPYCDALLNAQTGFDYITVAPGVYVLACHFCKKALGPYAPPPPETPATGRPFT